MKHFSLQSAVCERCRVELSEKWVGALSENRVPKEIKLKIPRSKTKDSDRKMLKFSNDGQELIETNFWDSPIAARGYFFLSVNAGAMRLLVPDAQLNQLRDIETGQDVIVSIGRWKDVGLDRCIEIMFDDGSEAPFSIHMVPEQVDRGLSKKDEGIDIPFHVVTRIGVFLRRKAKLRIVEEIPCLEAWAG